MRPSDVAKKVFHFAGDGVWYAKSIIAATIEEAEKIWHATKVPITPPSSAPAASPPAITAAPAEQKVEDKSTDILQ